MTRMLFIALLSLIPAVVHGQEPAEEPVEERSAEEEAADEEPAEASTEPVAPMVAGEQVAGEQVVGEQATSGARHVTLAEMLEAAAQNAAVIQEHTARMEKAHWQQYRAKWAAGPKMRSETGFAPVPANAKPDAFGQNIDEFLALDIGPYVRQKFSVLFPVYTFGRINTIKALAALGVDAAALERDKAARDVQYQVRRAFYSLQLSTAFDALLEEGSALIKENLVKMEDARDFGEGDFDIKDFRKLQVFDAEVDGRVLQNRQLYGIAEAGLGYFTGVTEDVEVAALSIDAELPELGSLATYLDQARQTRPDFALLDSAVRARELQVKLARRDGMPNIFIGAELGIGWSTENPALTPVCRRVTADADCTTTSDLFALPYSNPLNFLSFGVALGMRWDFDYWQQRGKVKEALAQQQEVHAQQKRAIGAIELEVEKIWRDAHTALELVSVTQRRLDAARRWRDQLGLSMQSGAGNIKDAVEPLQAYFEAQVLHLQARYDYLVARAALAQAVGVDQLDQ